MKNISVIALNAFKESVRDKVLYNIVFFALLLILFSLLLGEWSVFAKEKVIKDFTLAVMSIFGLLMAIFIGIGLVQKEIQRKTIFTLLAKPIPRWHLIVGKYLGLLAVLGVNLVIMTVFFYLVMWMTGSKPNINLLQAIYLIYLEMALVVAAALLFSSFSTPVLSALFTFGVYLAGHLSGDVLKHLEFMARHGDRIPGALNLPDWFLGLTRFVYYFVVPNLENFNIKAQVVHHLAVPVGYTWLMTGYALLFISAFLLITCIWFNRRDFV